MRQFNNNLILNNMIYQQVKIVNEKVNSITKEKILVVKDTDVIKGINFINPNKIINSSIPKDLKNPDYRNYITWLESGKKPLPFDLKIQDKDAQGNPVILYSEQELIDMTNQGSL